MRRALAHLTLLCALGFGVLSTNAPHAAAEPAATPPTNDVGAVDWGDPSPTPARMPTVAEAKAYARKRLGGYHYACLDAIATRESHWNPKARNRTSGAFGIFQALPPEKMRRYGADYMTNPLTQVRFGIAYARARYGSPCAAWGFWQQNGWW